MSGYLGKRGDSYDRFLIRTREMYESVNIIFQILTNLTGLTALNDNFNNLNSSTTNFFSFFDFLYANKYKKISHQSKYTSMESLINHFKYYSEGIKVPKGFAYR